MAKTLASTKSEEIFGSMERETPYLIFTDWNPNIGGTNDPYAFQAACENQGGVNGHTCESPCQPVDQAHWSTHHLTLASSIQLGPDGLSSTWPFTPEEAQLNLGTYLQAGVPCGNSATIFGAEPVFCFDPAQNVEHDPSIFEYNLSPQNLENNIPCGGFVMEESRQLVPYVQPAQTTSSNANIALRQNPSQERVRTPGTPRQRHACTVSRCEKTFGRPAEFRRHMKTVHKRHETPQVHCMMCDYTYPRIDKVREHMEKMHGLRVHIEKSNEGLRNLA